MDDHPSNKRNKNSFASSLVWQQKPLSKSEISALEYDECRKMSIRTKIILFLAAALFIFGFLSVLISYQVYMDSAIQHHKHIGEGMARLVVSAINPNTVNEYLALGSTAEGYEETKRPLYRIKETMPATEFIYVYKIEEDGCHVVFDLDTDTVKGEAPGTVIPLDDSLQEHRPLLLQGGNIHSILSEDKEHGWLLSIYSPIYDEKGVCQCYAAIDISIDHIQTEARDFIVTQSLLFLFILVVILLAAFWLAKYNLILPINTMSHSAGIFAYHNEEALEKSLERISKLDIRTGDEVENLYRSFVTMTRNSVRYMTDIRKKSETIAKMQTALILTLADMVERRDKNTGQHIRKTAAYVKIIAEEMQRRGIYPEILTDEYVQNMVESAPLHDVGKITIPDAILNKPGKLTEEEFELMKSHSTAGGKIIDTLIETVPDSEYLYEAKNLATYHHERWDGTGYPAGLSGEGIPLSSRIMAVADVFDALISTRSYKKGFPYEKALEIIQEESGSHFDPNVVDAFLASKDKILAIAEEFHEMELDHFSFGKNL